MAKHKFETHETKRSSDDKVEEYKIDYNIQHEPQVYTATEAKGVDLQDGDVVVDKVTSASGNLTRNDGL